MNFRLFSFFVSWIISTGFLIAQSSSNIQLIKETEGIPIINIIADRKGQIWMATSNNGLMLYNGYGVKKFEYDPNDTTAIKGNTILSLYEDKYNKIWLSSFEGELIKHNPLTQQNIKYQIKPLVGKNDNTEFLTIQSIQFIHGNIYFTVAHDSPLSKSIFTYDYSKDKLIPFAANSKHPDYSYFFIPDTKGNALILGQDAQVYELSTTKDTITKLPFSELQELANRSNFLGNYDSQNRLWFVNNKGGLYRFDTIYTNPTRIYSFKHLIPPGVENIIPTSIVFDQDQNIWIGSHHGLYYFNLATENFSKVEMPLDGNDKTFKIEKLYADNFNNIWIGTMTGLLKYENKPVFYDYASKTADTSYRIGDDGVAMINLMHGEIAFASFNINSSKVDIKLHFLNPATNKMKYISLTDILPSGADFRGISEAGKDTFIIGSDRGVYRLATISNKINKINLPGLPATHPGISQYYRDKYGNEWLGSSNYLYKKLAGEEKYIPIDLSTQPGGTDQSNAVTVEDAKHHGLWLITRNGLFLYNYTSQKIKRLGFNADQTKNFHSQEINSTYTEDSADIAWIAIRGGGLAKLNIATGNVKNFTTQHGLPDMKVHSLVFDEKNDALWLGTANGISRFNLKTESFTNFSAADGIQGKEFYSVILSAEGEIFFGGRGLIRFKPDDIKTESLPPIVSITDFKISNKSIAYTVDSFTLNTVITLKHNQNYISIDFLGVHYTDPKNNKYAYMLEGFEPEWNQVTNQHTANYTNLPTGEYIFKIKAANSNGVWNEQGASLKIKILPPWWRTRIAFLFYLFGAIGLIMLGNNRYKDYVLKQERSLSQAKEIAQAKEIEKAYKELEQSHKTLQTTQAQLIQSEKMASLGELTAGIAHEIQNPLNFVNNFSELNSELVKELEEEANSGMRDANNEAALLKAIKENSEKINHHGKRAESIVKGMLEHSRKSTGIKEPIDINKLCEEYVRLSYHGLRAKDKEFNCDFKLDLDPNLPMIHVVSQDIGRVILNIVNNAFQACAERGRMENKTSKLPSPISYIPLVTLKTKFEKSPTKSYCEIHITDNGPGIPDSIKDKIFQPFFTTKPTGQGTGLGLSLSYDMVKAHGGELKVERATAKEGEGSRFIIQLPIF